MRLYTPSELRGFLEAVDAALTKPVGVVVIGGAAAAVQYGVAIGTRDIDTWTRIHGDFAAAVEHARATSGLRVPLEHAGAADAPYEFESRLERTLPHLTRLIAYVPEKHDLALMKMLRGTDRDLEAIEALHLLTPLSAETLVDRFETELDAAIGNPVRLRGNVLVMIERLFPARADEMASRLRGGRTRGRAH